MDLCDQGEPARAVYFSSNDVHLHADSATPLNHDPAKIRSWNVPTRLNYDTLLEVIRACPKDDYAYFTRSSRFARCNDGPQGISLARKPLRYQDVADILPNAPNLRLVVSPQYLLEIPNIVANGCRFAERSTRFHAGFV